MMRYATSTASRVPVMCSEFIARTVRTAVPRTVPVSVAVPGRRRRAFPPRPAHRRPPRAPRDRRPAAGRLREPAGRSQGPGRVDPGIARIRRRVPDATLLIVGGGPYEERAARALRRASRRGLGRLRRCRCPRTTFPRYYAVGDVFAMPCRTAPGRHGGGGLGERVHRGGGVRAAGRGRRFRRRQRDGDRRGDRLLVDGATWMRSPTPSPTCSRTPSEPAGWGRRAASAWSGRTPGPRSPSRLAGWLRRGGRLAALPRSGAGTGGTLPAWSTRRPRRARTLRECGAVLYEGAAWCGQCFAPSLLERARARVARAGARIAPGTHRRSVATTVAEPARPRPSAGGSSAERHRRRRPGRPHWPCGSARRNPIELDFCATCGGPRSRPLMREETRAAVIPRDAFRWSLMFPGSGHRANAGRELDGFARGVLFGCC